MMGATGTIGQATVRILLERGHQVVCFIRPGSAKHAQMPKGAIVRMGLVTDPTSLAHDGLQGERFDAIVSCLASRTGTPDSAWEIDYKAHSAALAAGKSAGIHHMVLLSAICVQRPLLAFQQAKLAFERDLIASGLTYSIVRPTAFFKSLSGQVERVRKGKSFLIFGDGRQTSCKPISDTDLGAFIARCLDDEDLKNQILPIGGPGRGITPRDQGEELFRLMNLPPKFQQVPIELLNAIISGLDLVGHMSSHLRQKAELARIGRYYATESMLVLNPVTNKYDEDMTPSTGQDLLFDHYAKLIRNETTVDLGEHAVF